MNQLTMGPLKARQKAEGKNVIFRCGVQSCPEILAKAEPDLDQWIFTRSDGYSQNSTGIFVKSRRASVRDPEGAASLKSIREGFLDRAKGIEKLEELTEDGRQVMLIYIRSVIGNPATDYWESVLDEKNGAENRQKALRALQEEWHQAQKKFAEGKNSLLLPTSFSATFRCARCGNLSKISYRAG